jgi:beta-lactamase class D
MSTINNKVLESFRKKLSNDQLIQLFNLLNRIGFNRTLKSSGGSAGSLIDGSLNQSLKISTIDAIRSLRSMYQNGGLAQSEILDLLKKILIVEWVLLILIG